MAVTRLGAATTAGSGTTTASWTSFNIPTGNTNTVTIVLVNFSVGSSAAATCSVTYGGITMNQFGILDGGSASSRGGCGIYYLFNPPTGAQTVVATPAGATIIATRGIDVAFAGVSTLAPPQTATTMNLTVNSLTNGYALRVLSNGVTTGTLAPITGGGVTELAAGASVTGIGDFIAVQSAPGAATVSFTAGGTASTPLSVGISLNPSGQINCVQSLAGAQSFTASATVALPPLSFIGDTIVVSVAIVASGSASGFSVSSITDTAGNKYSVAKSQVLSASANLAAWIYYAPVTHIAAGTNTITATMSATPSAVEVIAAEYDGLAFSPLDVSGGASGSNAAFNSGNITTNFANELIVGYGLTDAGATAAGSGYTGRIVGTDNFVSLFEDKTVSSIGSYSTTGTLNSSQWAMLIATFKARLSPGTIINRVPMMRSSTF